MEEIIQRAPEYGVCKYLGANIFSYFVVGFEETNQDVKWKRLRRIRAFFRKLLWIS